MHMNHMPKLKEVHGKRIYSGLLDRFYSPYIFIIWVISCSNYGVPYVDENLAFAIQIVYCILAACHHTIIRKIKWDNDMHVLEDNTTNLTLLVLVDFFCTFLCSFVSIFFMCGFYESYLPIVAVSIWCSSLVLSILLHVFLYYCYESIVRNTMRRYASISEKI